MNFVIDDNKPMPVKTTGPKPSELTITLRKLKPGQSIFIGADYKTPTAIRGAAQYAQKRTGFSYSVRKDGDGLRVWRVA